MPGRGPSPLPSPKLFRGMVAAEAVVVRPCARRACQCPRWQDSWIRANPSIETTTRRMRRRRTSKPCRRPPTFSSRPPGRMISTGTPPTSRIIQPKNRSLTMDLFSRCTTCRWASTASQSCRTLPGATATAVARRRRLLARARPRSTHQSRTETLRIRLSAPTASSLRLFSPASRLMVRLRSGCHSSQLVWASSADLNESRWRVETTCSRWRRTSGDS